jgi:ribonuclease HI
LPEAPPHDEGHDGPAAPRPVVPPPGLPGLPRGTTVVPPLVRVHFDGACQPAHGGGVATFGFTVEGDLVGEEKGLAVAPWSPRATNNVAEYVAAVRALEWLRSRGFAGTVILLGDSQLIIRQMRGEYAVRTEHLRPYHEHLQALARGFAHVDFQWVPREENRRADALSKEALAEANATAGRLRRSSPAPRWPGASEDDADPDP